ncbi:50S ribosomal protein L1 [Candidatus Bathyarchaeota archaeon RBG_13_38_9]|nr:MAG: 50S ribosomal protein L1 [Candidatus Bathyarchaeota archaeon RBG_13_38_9]
MQKALEELRKNKKKRNFKESLELIIKLKELDLKKPENRINQTIILPHDIGKSVKVCVIATGQLELKSKEANADLVLGKDQLTNLGNDKKAAKKLLQEYGFFVAEAHLMPLVGKTIGPTLGPRGKMPTIINPDAPIADVIDQARRTIKIRVRDQPVIQCRIGVDDMSDDNLSENIQAIFSSIEGKLERGVRNISKVLIKTTMHEPVNLVL